MGRPVSFDFTTGGGSPEEFLMGTVHLEPTMMHAVGDRIVLPDAPYPVKLVNGKALHNDVAISPDGPEPAWAYKVTIESSDLDGRGKKGWTEYRGVPAGTEMIPYKRLPQFQTMPQPGLAPTVSYLVAEAIANDPTVMDAVNLALADSSVMLFGQSIGGSQDLDTFTTPGAFAVTNPGGIVDPVAQHFPERAVGTLLVVGVEGASPVITQYFTSNTGRLFRRTKTYTTWSSWSTESILSIGSRNLDDILEPGTYLNTFAGGIPAEPSGYPVRSTGILIVLGGYGEGTRQFFMTSYSPGGVQIIYMRSYLSTTDWTAWETMSPSSVAATPNREVLRDSAGRAKVASPAASDDIATKEYVDLAISGGIIESGSSRNFALYPASIQLASNAADLPTIGGVVTNLTTLSAADQAKYFAAPPMIDDWLGNVVLTNPLGATQSWFFGITTDSQKIRLLGTHLLQTSGTTVLIDGKPTDPSSFVVFPTYKGTTSGIYLSFPTKRVRTIEILTRMKLTRFEVETGAQCAPYRRPMKSVAVIGDSWIDGTSQARDNIGHILQTQLGWNVLISAQGGSGYTVAGTGKAFTDATRVGAVAALAPDVCIIYGSINDGPSTPAAVASAANTMITTLRNANPAMKIILTGPQLKSSAWDAIGSALQDVATASTDVTYHSASAFSGSGFTGPFDGAHPSPVGARRIAEWLISKIRGLIGDPL